MVLNQQGAEGKRLGGRPVDVLARLEHLALGVELARDLAIEVEVGRHPGQGLADLAQRFQRHRRLAATRVEAARAVEARPRAPQPDGLELGRARVGKEFVRTCRSRWSAALN